MDTETLRRELGLRIKLLRIRAGLKQSELSAKLDGVSANLISNWEAGYSAPNIFVLLDLAAALHCTPFELLGSTAPELTSDEVALLSAFRDLDEDGQHTVWAVIDSQLKRLNR